LNKTAIRNFAVWARNKLINDVTYRAGLMGVTANGIADPLPQSTDNVQFFDIGMAEPYQITGEEIKQRKSLVEIIKRKEKDSDYATAFTSVVEEVAYTWFNRLIAIRFMEVNDYLPSHIRVLSSESGKLEPDLVTTPYDADLFFVNGDEQVVQNLKNENKLDEVFRMLFIKQCNALYEILPRLFESISDYTELLLNVSFIDQDGVVYHLVNDIPEEDFNVELGGQVEIIGWLYQFYNAELKDETFAKLKQKIKLTKESVPAATQLFTPDWIVKYMVENSLGRCWNNGHPDDLLVKKLNYYLETAKQNEVVEKISNSIKEKLSKIELSELKFFDPCMGSGHILVCAFDVLMQIYENAGWSQRDAARSIVEKNIYGVDVDERAAQLAYFAVLMKARKYNRRIFDNKVEIHVTSICESNGFDRNCLHRFDNLQESAKYIIDIFENAKELGSILKVGIDIDKLDSLKRTVDEIVTNSEYGNVIDRYEAEIISKDFNDLLMQAFILAQKYDVIVTNPPYMAPTENQKQYLKDNYLLSKNDLAMVFMERCLDYGKENAYVGMINFPTWMFLESYEELRKKLIKNNTIINMVYPGRGIFGSDFGSTSFVFLKGLIPDYIGTYLKLFDAIGEVDSVEQREKQFLQKKGICHLNQSDYGVIPGSPLAFWITDNMLDTFRKENIGSKSIAKAGIVSGNDELFLRLWFEIISKDIEFNAESFKDKQAYKWVPINKGGSYRRHYGNYDYVINIYDLWNSPEKVNVSVRRSEPEYYFKKGLTWSATTMGASSYRYSNNKTFATAAPSLFFESDEELFISLALLNSCLSQKYMDMLNPTVGLKLANVTAMPAINYFENADRIVPISKENVDLCRDDWDSFETSWDFKKHPLI